MIRDRYGLKIVPKLIAEDVAGGIEYSIVDGSASSGDNDIRE